MELIFEPLTTPHLSERYVGELLPLKELSPVLLRGPKGQGKTMQVFAYAMENDYKLLIFEASEEARYGQIIGQFGLKGREAYFSLGIIPTAIQYANSGERFILLIEELNALSPAAQKQLNAFLDIKQGVTVKEIGQRFEFHNNSDDFLIVATMALTFYGGVFELNEDLKSRFNIVSVGYPPEDIERQILSQHTPDNELASKLVTLATQTRTSSFVYQLSTRDLVRAVKVINRLGLKWGLKVLEGKFEEEDRKTFWERVAGIFGEVK